MLILFKKACANKINLKSKANYTIYNNEDLFKFDHA